MGLKIFNLKVRSAEETPKAVKATDWLSIAHPASIQFFAFGTEIFIGLISLAYSFTAAC